MSGDSDASDVASYASEQNPGGEDNFGECNVREAPEAKMYQICTCKGQKYIRDCSHLCTVVLSQEHKT
jgi:hypothetical protein